MIFEPSEFLKWFASVSFGLIVGSFLNVVIYRLPRDQSLVRPASRCPSCQTPIRWYSNIPVFSWLAQRGRCRSCKAPISVRYPIVELLTALLFTAAMHVFGLTLETVLRGWPFLAMLIATTYIDLDHRIIPDEISLGGLVYGLLTSLLTADGVWPAFVGAAVGFGVFYAFSWTYWKLTGRVGLGGGDIKLLAMLGAFLGFQGVFATIFLSSVVGSVIGVGYGVIRREKKLMTVAIPYGPFLVLGALTYYFLGQLLWLPFTIPT